MSRLIFQLKDAQQNFFQCSGILPYGLDYAYKVCKTVKKKLQFHAVLSRFTFSKYGDTMTRKEITILSKLRLAQFYEISTFSQAVIK